MKLAVQHNWYTDAKGVQQVVRLGEVVSDNHPAVKQGGIFVDAPDTDAEEKPAAKKKAAPKKTKSK